MQPEMGDSLVDFIVRNLGPQVLSYQQFPASDKLGFFIRGHTPHLGNPDCNLAQASLLFGSSCRDLVYKIELWLASLDLSCAVGNSVSDVHPYLDYSTIAHDQNLIIR